MTDRQNCVSLPSKNDALGLTQRGVEEERR